MAATATQTGPHIFRNEAFLTGPYSTKLVETEKLRELQSCKIDGCWGYREPPPMPYPPKPVLIACPLDYYDGEFPVVIMLHGYLLYNSFYSQMMRHIASHGFIVVAPQLYTLTGPDCTEEIDLAAAIANWLPEGLNYFLPHQINPNLAKLGLAGHSRGGKVAFALALASKKTTLKFSALIGIDPVDGMDKGAQTPPPVLTYAPNAFDLNMPVMVIGSGYGEIKKNPLFPACAPKGVNHWDFYQECNSPACYVVAKDYGHLDMLDDETKGIRGIASYCICKCGKSRGPMRKFVGGAVVAFMKAYLGDETEYLTLLKDYPILAPVEIQMADFRV